MLDINKKQKKMQIKSYLYSIYKIKIRQNFALSNDSTQADLDLEFEQSQRTIRFSSKAWVQSQAFRLDISQKGHYIDSSMP